ncbi:MAG: hypothetical protein KF830_04100 [Planctomycetes bacterium]|nr:hypothetical protein [Planctomycetota bacterium]
MAVAVLGLAAWWGVWRGQFLFDDHPAIVDNLALQAGDGFGAAFGPRHQPLANRPLTCWSLVLDFAVFGPGPRGPHLTNLLLHLANALLLLATARRALRGPNLGAAFPPARATAVATAVAGLWGVHPLAADAVAYATQRSTLLFSACLLLACLATARGTPAAAAPSRAHRAWRAVAVAAVALGMAGKEDFVTAPLLVVLFQRAFLLPSWAAVARQRGFLAALAASWLVLAVCLGLGPSNPTVGYATAAPVTAWRWLLTQAPVVVLYARLAVWPWPLRGAYDDGVVASLAEAALPGLLVLAALAATVLAWRRRPWWGFLGALWFLLLAPTSTVLPIVTEITAERRAYLPMLAVLVPVVLGVERLTSTRRWLRGPLWLAAVAALAAVAQARVAVYADPARFWQDAFDRRDPQRRTSLAAQILDNHGSQLWQQGRFDEAHACFEQAVRCDNPTAIEHVHHAVSLQRLGRHVEAVRILRDLAVLAPEHVEVLGNLGTALLTWHHAEGAGPGDARLVEAEAALARSVALQPNRIVFWNSLAYVWKVLGRLVESEAAYRRVTGADTDRVEPFLYHAEVLERLGRSAEIPALFERLLAGRPTDVGLRLHIAEIDLRRGDLASVRRLAGEALQLEPGNARAAALLRQAESRGR